jgi:hypothetical protein
MPARESAHDRSRSHFFLRSRARDARSHGQKWRQNARGLRIKPYAVAYARPGRMHAVLSVLGGRSQASGPECPASRPLSLYSPCAPSPRFGCPRPRGFEWIASNDAGRRKAANHPFEQRKPSSDRTCADGRRRARLCEPAHHKTRISLPSLRWRRRGLRTHRPPVGRRQHTRAEVQKDRPTQTTLDLRARSRATR